MENTEPAKLPNTDQLPITDSPKTVSLTSLPTTNSVNIMNNDITNNDSIPNSSITSNNNSTTHSPTHIHNNNSNSISRSSGKHEYTFRQSNNPEMTSEMNDSAEELTSDNNSNLYNLTNSLNNTQISNNNNNNNNTTTTTNDTTTNTTQHRHNRSNTISLPSKTIKYAASSEAVQSSSNDAEEWITIQAQPSDVKYDNELVYVQVTKADAMYNLKPIHCGRSVVFLNAQDPAFYTRTLPNPSLLVWLLSSSLSISQSHALKRLFESGWRQNIQVRVMETNNFELIASKDGLESVLYNGQPIDLPDAIFNRVGANVGYFGMAVIRQLENMGVLIFNNLRSIEISKDKMLTLQHLAAHGLPIPKTLLAKFPLNLEAIRNEFNYPIILKKASGSQGKGIVKLDNHNQLEDLVDMLDTTKPVIFQEFIQASSGKDLRVFVVGGRVVGAMMRIAAKGQFKANVHQGGTTKPVKISPQVEWLVLETVKIVGLDIAGVDLLIDEKTYKICEVNSSPGFEGLEKALGENIAIKMFLYMKMRLGVWRRTAGNKSGRSGISINVPVEEDYNYDNNEFKQNRDEESSGFLPPGISATIQSTKANSRKFVGSSRK